MAFIFNYTIARSFAIAVVGLSLGVAAVPAQAARADIIDKQAVETGIPDLLRAEPDKTVATANAAAPLATQSRGVIRSRPLTIDFSALQKVRADIAANQPALIRMGFFDDAALLVQITRIEHFGSSG